MRAQSNPFTGNVAREYDSWYQTPWGRFADTQQRRLFLTLARPKAGELLLDVGCGTGRYLVWLASLGIVPVGVDISQDMLSVAQHRLRAEGLPERIVLADAQRLPFAAESFDIATAITTLEFVSHPEKVLSEMGRVARRIFVGALNKRSRLYRQQSQRKGPLSLARWFAPNELVRLVQDSLPGWRWRIRTCLLSGRFHSPASAWLAALAESLAWLGSPNGGFIGLAAWRPEEYCAGRQHEE